MKKKILIYTMIMKKGGAEQVIANLANHFIDYYDITIVTNINCASEYDLNTAIKYFTIDSKNKRNENIFKKIVTKLGLKRSKKLKKIIEIEQPNLILAFLPEPTIRMLSLKKYFPNIPMIFSIRNNPQKEFYYPFLKPVRDFYYQKADKIIIQDKSYQKYISCKVQNKLEVIPNFISPDFMNVKRTKKKEKFIVTVARLEKQKNLNLLIDAFSELGSEFNDYKLHICGDGKERKNLEKKIKKLGLENRVILRGRVKSVVDEIKGSSLFVLSSNYEGMPNVLLEAMALSLPVISTNSTEAITNIIDDHINGIIVDKNNKKMLTEKMAYILRNPHIAKKMALEAGKVKQKYAKNNIINKWHDIFNEYL